MKFKVFFLFICLSWECRGTHVARGRLMGLSCLSATAMPGMKHLGHQAWQQVPSHLEPSHWPWPEIRGMKPVSSGLGSLGMNTQRTAHIWRQTTCPSGCLSQVHRTTSFPFLSGATHETESVSWPSGRRVTLDSSRVWRNNKWMRCSPSRPQTPLEDIRKRRLGETAHW